MENKQTFFFWQRSFLCTLVPTKVFYFTRTKCSFFLMELLGTKDHCCLYQIFIYNLSSYNFMDYNRANNFQSNINIFFRVVRLSLNFQLIHKPTYILIERFLTVNKRIYIHSNFFSLYFCRNVSRILASSINATLTRERIIKLSTSF